MKALLHVQNLSFSYEKGEQVLEDINFDIAEGENIGLIGANGVGKSTLMKLLVGLCEGYDGELSVGGLPVVRKNMDDIREMIGYVFQDSDNQLFMANVYEDVAFAPRNYGYSEEDVRSRVDHALEMVGINHLSEKQIYKLSGGEKKLTSIATILSMEPRAMLMDEPTTALDPRHRRELIKILGEIPTAKLIASHDLEFIEQTCERTILMWQGRVVYDGATANIIHNQEFLEKNGL